MLTRRALAPAPIRTGVTAALAALALASCRSAKEEPRGADDRARPLEVVVPTEIATLDPRFATRSLDVKVTRLVHAGLFGLAPDDLSPVPLLAESHARVDPLTLRVHLRPGLRFHGGSPVTSRDVCATLDAVGDPSLGSPHRAVVQAFASCEPRAPLEVVLRLARPRATVLSDLEIPVLREDQARAAPRPDGTLDGAGPYVVSRLEHGAVHLSPAAPSALPEARRALVVRTVRDENARAQRLLAGRSDVAPNAISPGLLPALDGADHVEVASRPGANVTYLLFHNERAPFDRADVRRAASAAIDRALVVRTLLAGRAQVATSLLPPGHWAAAPDDGGAGATVAAMPPGLGPVTLLTSTDRARVVLARAVAGMLSDAGLDTRVMPLDLGVMLARLDAGDFECAILQIPELTEPNVLSWFFHPRGVPGEGGLGRNRARYRNPEAGRLLDRASESSARGERQEDYRAFAALVARDLPVAPLWHEDQIVVVSERARGFRPSADGRWLALAALR